MTSRLNKLKEALREGMITRMLEPQMDLMERRYGQEYLDLADRTLEAMEGLGYDAADICGRYIYDYLTQLDYFMENGDYGHKDYERIRQEIYDNREVMMETYMPGLLMAYIITSILYEKYHAYNSCFLPRLKSGAQGLEVGFGEGFYLWNLYGRFPGTKLKGFDISASAKEFAERLFAVSGIPEKDCDLRLGNIIKGLPVCDASMDYAILAEVIEHIPEPEQGVREMARTLKKGGLLYLSTVIDSNHMDHMVNFSSPAVVEEMIGRSGFDILDMMIYRVRDDYPKSQDKSVGLAYVTVRM